MPNWCMNSVEIVGDVETLEAIAAAAKEGKLLEYLAPIGEWDYNTAVEAWGTKWDVTCDDPHLDLDSNTLTMHFDSAWSPPVNAYQKGEESHDIRITAYYYEPGMMFTGKYADFEYSLDFEDENWKDDIPDDIIDHWDLESEYESWKEWQQEDEEEDTND